MPETLRPTPYLHFIYHQIFFISDNGIPEWQLDAPTPEEVEAAIAAGTSSLEARDSLESSNPSLPVNSPSYRHQVSIKTSARATNLARSAYVMEVATKRISQLVYFLFVIYKILFF